jgi:hypothetical protein
MSTAHAMRTLVIGMLTGAFATLVGMAVPF